MPVGAAIVGSAAIGGIASNSAAKKAASAQQSATDQSAAIQQRQYDQTRSDNEPFRQLGLAGLNQIASAYGLNPTIDWTKYVANQPDVLENWQAVHAQQPNLSLEDFAKQHYNLDKAANGGQGRDLSSYQVQASPQTVQTVQAPGGGYTLTTNADGSVTGNRPNVGTAPTYARPGVQDFSYTDRPAAGAFSYAPRSTYGPLDVSLNAFNNSPEALAAKQALQQLSDSSNGQFAATGALQSGAAAKALSDRAQDNAVQFYGQFANRTGNQYNIDRSRSDANYDADYGKAFNAYQYGNNLAQTNYNTDYGNAFQRYQYGTGLAQGNFDADRSFGTQQYNTQTALAQDLYNQDRSYATAAGQQRLQNLFGLAGYGQNANSANTAAGNVYANGVSNGLFSAAAAQGNAALTNAANLNNLLNTGVNAYAYYQGKQPTVKG